MRFTGHRALERSASVWQRCCAGEVGRRIRAVAPMKETGTMQTSALTAEPSVHSAFISHLGQVNVYISVPGVSGKKRDPLLCFCITSQSLVSLELATPDLSLGCFPLRLSLHDVTAV